jgi:hypothetical protein
MVEIPSAILRRRRLLSYIDLFVYFSSSHPTAPCVRTMPSKNALESPDSCTIAWIAALPIERAAAEAMLDEEHAAPTGFARHKTDANVYTWGRIGKPQDCKIPCAALWSHHDHSVSKNRTVPMMDCEPAFRMTCGRVIGDDDIVPGSLINVTQTYFILQLAS